MSAAAAHPISPELFVDRNSRWVRPLALLGSDTAALFVAAVALHGLSFVQRTDWYYLLPIPLVLGVLWLTGMGAQVALNPVHEFRKGFSAVFLVFGGLCGFLYFESYISRIQFLGQALCSVSLLLVFRSLLRITCAKRSWWTTPAVLFGGGPTGRQLLGILERNPSMGLRVIAALDNDFSAGDWVSNRRVARGRLTDAAGFARGHNISYAIVAAADLRDYSPSVLTQNLDHFEHVLVVPDSLGLSSLWVSAKDIGGLLGLEVRQNLARPMAALVKRSIDVAIGGTALLFASPLVAIIYLSIRLSSPGPVYYGQSRVGRNQQPFTAWKFRSMVKDADSVLLSALAADAALREEWDRDHKLRNDPRITRIGKILRKTSLDELPQLWNIVRGDMSLVGPRPIVSHEISRYGETFSRYCRVRPGLTGLWQVSGRNDTTYDERVSYDEYYVRNWSIWLDLHIICRTVKTVVLGEGAY